MLNKENKLSIRILLRQTPFSQCYSNHILIPQSSSGELALLVSRIAALVNDEVIAWDGDVRNWERCLHEHDAAVFFGVNASVRLVEVLSNTDLRGSASVFVRGMPPQVFGVGDVATKSGRDSILINLFHSLLANWSQAFSVTTVFCISR